MDLSWSKLNTTPATMPFGLDISDGMIRAVQLKRQGAKSFSLRCKHELPLPSGVIQSGEILDQVKLSGYINKLITRRSADQFGQRITAREVISVLPEPKTFIKLVTFAWPANARESDSASQASTDPSATIQTVLAQELSEDIPLSLEDATYDYHILRGNPHTAKPGDTIQLLTAIAPKKIVADYTAVLEASGLVPVALEVEGLAIARAVIPWTPQPSAPSAADTINIIVDLGANRTGMIIYHNGIIRYSLSVPVSGRAISQKIADKEKISFPEAEKMKLSHSLTGGNSDIDAIIRSSLDILISRLREALVFCQVKLSDSVKPQILLCGGGALWAGLTAMLSQQLNVPVGIADPFVNFSNKSSIFLSEYYTSREYSLNHSSPQQADGVFGKVLDKPSGISASSALSLTTAIGLALGGLYDYA
ncbi:pilus assembly protein PilM [Candidatus Falkowbacteria bacterium]|nr:pilus assembly protein PilM [Candidatus Falkowbacteria bacterium]